MAIYSWNDIKKRWRTKNLKLLYFSYIIMEKYNFQIIFTIKLCIKVYFLIIFECLVNRHIFRTQRCSGYPELVPC